MPNSVIRDAVAHLLRHLDDADTLRANVLAAPYFAAPGDSARGLTLSERSALARIRAAVIAAAERLVSDSGGIDGMRLRRQHAIVMRCDLNGEPHEKVAADLGISRREFYRERKRARAKLGDAIAAEAPVQKPIPPVTASEFDVRLDYVRSLAALGQFEGAGAELRRLISGSASAMPRVRAWCELVEIDCDAGLPADAAIAIAAARQAREHAGCSVDVDRELEARVSLSAGLLAWRSGDPETSATCNRQAIASLRSSDSSSFAAACLLATALVRNAAQFADRGMASSALGAIAQAGEVLDRTPDASPLLRVEYFNAFAAAHAIVPGGIGAAVAALDEAISVSRRCGFLRGAADAAVNLSMLLLQRGQIQESLSFARSGLAVAAKVCGADEYAYMCLNASHAHAAARYSTDALNLVREARRRATAGGFEWSLALVAEGEALLSARAYAAAIRVASNATAAMQRLGVPRYVGAALRIRAEAQAGLHQRREASESISDAIEILERHGHAFSLATAYRCSAHITNNAKHKTAALDLLATLER